MKVGILFSGGKDSNLALYYASKQHEIKCLINLIPNSVESRLFHYPNSELVKLQAEALNLPLIQIKTGDEEKEQIKDLKKALLKAKELYNIEGIVTGAVKSKYQLSRFQKVCDELNLQCINPLWQKDEEEIINEILRLNFDVIITRLSFYPLNTKFLGEKISKEFIEFLKQNKVNITGEGGEYETFVLYQPLFKRRIKILQAKKEIFENEANYIVLEAVLE